MKTSLFQKVASILLSFGLMVGSLPTTAVSAPPAMPDFAKALTPPQSLGFLDSVYKGRNEHPVILIQDLHANYGVQKNIIGLLEFYQPQLTSGGRPMVLGIEGAWGKMDLRNTRRYSEKTRRAASEFLLKEAETSGMEYFAALATKPVEFYGIENPGDYIVHQELLRKSMGARLELAGKIDQMRTAITTAKADGNAQLRRLWKLSDDFHAGHVDLTKISKTLNVSLTDYGQAEAALAKALEAAAGNQKGDKAFYMKNVVQADRHLELLARLYRQQLSMEEVQYASTQVPAMITVVQALLPGENMQLWKDAVRSAIDHYAVALVRNKPMAEHAIELAEKYPNTSAVIVAGGFHTAGIVADFKARKISYVVVAPVVESHTAHDERLYLKRLMGLHVTQEQITKAAMAYSRGSAYRGTGVIASDGIVTAQTPGFHVAEPSAVISHITHEAMNGEQSPAAVRRLLNDQNPAGANDMERTIDAGTPLQPVRTRAGMGRILANLRGRFETSKDLRNMDGQDVDVNPAERNVVDVPATGSPAGQPNQPANRWGRGIKTTSVGIVGALGIANLAGAAEVAAQKPGLQQVVGAAADSTAWNSAMQTVQSFGSAAQNNPGTTALVVLGVAAIAGAKHWFGGTERGRKQMRQARMQLATLTNA